MVARRLIRISLVCRAIVLVATVAPGLGCVGIAGNGTSLATWKRPPDQPAKLTDVEQMIDELDRVLTAYGTISVKTPDVWGQDRLAKFRSEYESQMAAWLKTGFKTDINASVRRSESSATRVLVGTAPRSMHPREPPQAQVRPRLASRLV